MRVVKSKEPPDLGAGGLHLLLKNGWANDLRSGGKDYVSHMLAMGCSKKGSRVKNPPTTQLAVSSLLLLAGTSLLPQNKPETCCFSLLPGILPTLHPPSTRPRQYSQLCCPWHDVPELAAMLYIRFVPILRCHEPKTSA